MQAEPMERAPQLAAAARSVGADVPAEVSKLIRKFAAPRRISFVVEPASTFAAASGGRASSYPELRESVSLLSKEHMLKDFHTAAKAVIRRCPRADDSLYIGWIWKKAPGEEGDDGPVFTARRFEYDYEELSIYPMDFGTTKASDCFMMAYGPPDGDTLKVRQLMSRERLEKLISRVVERPMRMVLYEEEFFKTLWWLERVRYGEYVLRCEPSSAYYR